MLKHHQDSAVISTNQSFSTSLDSKAGLFELIRQFYTLASYRKFQTRIATSRAADQEGAATIEFLATMMVIFGVILAIFQFSLVFLNAVLVNHALAQASQEAAVRGAYDEAAQSVLLAYLPGQVRAQCLRSPCAFSTPNAEVSGVSRLGLECTREGETFDIVFRYEQDLLFLAAIGITRDISMQQEVTVASQSLNQQSYC